MRLSNKTPKTKLYRLPSNWMLEFVFRVGFKVILIRIRRILVIMRHMHHLDMLGFFQRMKKKQMLELVLMVEKILI